MALALPLHGPVVGSPSGRAGDSEGERTVRARRDRAVSQGRPSHRGAQAERALDIIFEARCPAELDGGRAAGHNDSRSHGTHPDVDGGGRGAAAIAYGVGESIVVVVAGDIRNVSAGKAERGTLRAWPQRLHGDRVAKQQIGG